MIWLILFFPLFLFSNDLAPILEGGRVRPLYGKELTPETKVLPDRYDSSWHALKEINNRSVKIRYKSREAILTHYNNGNYEALSDVLYEDYAELAGEPYQEAVSGSLNYPTRNQLYAEKIYLSAPWLGLLIGLYFLSLVSGSTPLFIFAIVFHTLLLASRIYILGRPPVANMMETMIYVPWISSLACLAYTHKVVIRIGSFLAVLILSILHFTFNASSLDTIQAVLNSNFWLTIHVLMIVASYGVLILSGILAHLYLVKPSPEKENLILKTLYIGVALLIPGTILGGVWAAESWGRFWDWDPKEAWAFISSALYVAVIHSYRYNKISGFGLAIGSIIGLNAITFTWYGVNYILGTGLHSYGFGNGGQIYYYIFVALEVIIIFVALLARFLKNKRKMC